jgi:ABC-type antimicrobial peptide transport system permease subunit
MGVRMALGTTPDRLRGMLLRQGLLIVVAGAIPGIIGARFTGRFLASPMDGALFVAACTSGPSPPNVHGRPRSVGLRHVPFWPGEEEGRSR